MLVPLRATDPVAPFMRRAADFLEASYDKPALVAFSEPGGMPGLAAAPGGKRLSSTAYVALQRALIGIPDGTSIRVFAKDTAASPLLLYERSKPAGPPTCSRPCSSTS